MNENVMDAPERTFLALLGEYWGYMVGFAAGLATLLTLYHKYLRKLPKAIIGWITAAIKLPVTLEAIQAELRFENGIGLREKLTGYDENMAGFRRMLASETANRRMTWQYINTPIFEADKNGKFLWANTSYLDLTECDLPEITGNNWRNSIAGPDRTDVVDAGAMAVTDGTDCKVKFRMVTTTNEQWVAFHAICNKDDLGNVLGFVGRLKPTDDPRIHRTA